MAIDWSKLFNKYKGLWIALESDEETVIASGTSAKEVFESAQKKGYDKPIMTHMPEELATYVGFGI